MARRLRHHQPFQRAISRETQHCAVRKRILPRHFPMPGELRHCRQLNPARTNRSEVLPLACDQCGRCRKSDVRNRVVDITPENISAYKQSLTKRIQTDAGLTAGESLRTQISIRVGHDISHTKVSVKLIERGRAKRSVRRSTHFNTLVEALRQPHTRAKRRFRSIRKAVERRSTNHGRAIRKSATVEPVVESTSETKLPRSDVNRVARKNSQRPLPPTGIDESRDPRIVKRRLRTVTAHFATFYTESQHLVISEIRC